MSTNFEKVKEFHHIFGHEIQNTPGWPTSTTLHLRGELIKEEYLEVQFALAEGELHEIAKELADLLYVVYGTGAAFGFDMDKIFAEVHRSNMSKLTADGKVLRRDDGKILKSDQYRPADIISIVGVEDPLEL